MLEPASTTYSKRLLYNHNTEINGFFFWRNEQIIISQTWTGSVNGRLSKMLDRYPESGRRIPQWAPTVPSWGISLTPIPHKYLPPWQEEGHEALLPRLTRWKNRRRHGCLLTTQDLPSIDVKNSEVYNTLWVKINPNIHNCLQLTEIWKRTAPKYTFKDWNMNKTV